MYLFYFIANMEIPKTGDFFNSVTVIFGWIISLLKLYIKRWGMGRLSCKPIGKVNPGLVNLGA